MFFVNAVSAGLARSYPRRAPQAAVLVDEAYFEFCGKTLLRECRRFPNLFVTRTFSKAYGLAGLRVGYALGHPDVIDLMNRVRQPFNVNAIAQAAAVAALDDHAFAAECVRRKRLGLTQREERGRSA